MIDFETTFNGLAQELKGQLKRIPCNSEVKPFCGINSHGELRLSFMSPVLPPKIDSTRCLNVSVVQESERVFWISFDLINNNAKLVFFSLCEDLLNVVEAIKEAPKALQALKSRFFAWKTLFQQEVSLSEEQTIGLIGELYFLKNYLIPELGADIAIESWSGPEGASKDFSTKDTWYEIKAVSLNSNSVKISSITQLSSPIPGKLVIFRYETMSDQYTNSDTNLLSLFREIIKTIENDETKTNFISKLMNYQFDITGNSYKKKYRIDSMNFYSVDNLFPRLQESDIHFPEIDKVVYTLIINSLERFKEIEVKDANN